MGQIDPTYVITALIVIFFAIGLHEYAHCKMADIAGDPTPRYYGRVTLNLFKHFDPIGTIMIIVTTLTGFGIGWGKPAPMDARKMHNPRWDFFAAVAAGPICNFFQAVIYAVVFRVLLATQSPALDNNFVDLLIKNGVIINLSLMCFNLIPLGPLDGHWLVGQFLPEDSRYRWNIWNMRTGTYILFGLILLGNLSHFDFISDVLIPPVLFLYKFLTGLQL